MKMKVLIVKCPVSIWCKYPDHAATAEEFAEYLEENHDSVISLEAFSHKRCVPPYFIDGDTEIFYLRVSEISLFWEDEITVLSEEEYETRLRDVVLKKCADCIHFIDDGDYDLLKGHREKINLDGECFGFKPKITK